MIYDRQYDRLTAAAGLLLNVAWQKLR